MDVLILPSAMPHTGCVRRITVFADSLAEADDVVGEAWAACAIQWPGAGLARVMNCRVVSRGDELEIFGKGGPQ